MRRVQQVLQSLSRRSTFWISVLRAMKHSETTVPLASRISTAIEPVKG